MLNLLIRRTPKLNVEPLTSDHNAEVQYDPIGDGNCLFETTLKAAKLWTCQAKG